MTEKLIRDNQTPTGGNPNQLNVFWEAAAGPSYVLTDGHKQISATVFFHERLEPLKFKPEEPERNKRVREFQNWLPFSEREMNTITDGAVTRIRKAHNTKNGVPRRAVEETYKGFAKFLQDSYQQLNLLEQGLMTPEDSESEPDTQAIRELIINDPQFQALIAEYFYHKEALDHYPKKPEKKRKGFFHGAVIAAAENAGDSTINAMFEHAYMHALHREQYWQREIALVGNIDFVKAMLADPTFTPPSLMRRRSNEEQNANFEQEEEAATKAGKLVIKDTYHEGMPPEVLEANIAYYAEPTREIARRLEHSQADPHAIELDELGGQAIWDGQGNVIGVDKEDKDRATYADAYAAPKRPPPRRSGFGIKADIGNADKVVEDTYPPLDKD
jgi:hypothetical protein